jgi:excisionase family DNA binding protein
VPHSAAAPPERRSRRPLRPAEAAEQLGVDPQTLGRWADAGKVKAIRTLGGQRRYSAEEIETLAGGAA